MVGALKASLPCRSDGAEAKKRSANHHLHVHVRAKKMTADAVSFSQAWIGTDDAQIKMAAKIFIGALCETCAIATNWPVNTQGSRHPEGQSGQ